MMNPYLSARVLPYSGKTIYFNIRNRSLQFWRPTSFENYNSADLSLYAIFATELGAGSGPASGLFFAPTPGIPAGDDYLGDMFVMATSVANITNISVTGNVATITTSAAHGFTVNRSVIIASLTNTFLNGTWTILSVGTTTFTFAVTHANVATTADSGTAVSSVASPSSADTLLSTSQGFWDGTNWHNSSVNVDIINGQLVTALGPIVYPGEIIGSVSDTAPNASSFKGSSNLSAVNGFYSGLKLNFLSGVNVGQTRTIQNYFGASNKMFFFAIPFPNAPSNNDPFVLIGSAI